MTSDQIVLAIGTVVVLAVACQVVAPKLRLPALVLLLPVGFLVGALLPSVDPVQIFGDAFTPMVNLTVAVILFHGGLELMESPVDRSDRRIVHRLVWLGSPITWVVAAVAAYFLLDLPAPIAVLLGAILIVSGPTVVGPLLNFVRPQARIRRLLAWEGTLVDPVGALTAVIVFQGVAASGEESVGQAVRTFALSMLIGGLCALLGLALIWAGLRLTAGNRMLGTEVLLAAVIGAAALADALADDAGLVTGVAMGMAAPFLVREGLSEVKPFFDTIVNLAIGILFISISALVDPASIGAVLVGSLILVAILVLVVRPLVAWLMTAGTTFTRDERLFIGWMAPRGIVAAATAASFSTELVSRQIPGGDKLLPIVFLVIAGTVVIYSVTAVPVAGLLGVRAEEQHADLSPVDR